MKYCQRCNESRADEEVQPIDNASASGPGCTIYVCRKLCKPVPTQTGPVGRW